MKELLYVRPNSQESERITAALEVPLVVRIPVNKRRQAIIKTANLIENGSSDNYDLALLYAWAVKEVADESKNTVESIKYLKESVLGNELYSPSNIAAIRALLSSKNEAVRLIDWAFNPDGDSPKDAQTESDFAFFANDDNENVTAGTKTIAYAINLLAKNNALDPSESVGHKIDLALSQE